MINILLSKNSDITFKDVCLDHDKPILEKISLMPKQVQQLQL